MLKMISVSLIMILAGCSNKTKVTTEQVPKILFEWSRTACLGTCPVFDLSIDELGNIKFTGIAHVLKEGEAITKIAEIELNHLVDLVQHLKFSDLQKNYDAMITDVPSSTILYQGKGSTCRGETPLEFEILERELALLAIKYKLVAKNKLIRPADKSRAVILEAEDEVSYVDLILKFSEYGLELVQKISLTKPIVLLGFQRDYSVDEIIEQLKDEPGVVHIEPNRTLKRR